jgi:hypothetical protein
VVPYTHKVENPQHQYLNNLDMEMSQILSSTNIPVDDKMKLYDQTLRKFNTKYQQYSESNTNVIPQESAQVQIVNDLNNQAKKTQAKKSAKWQTKKFF